MKEKRHMIIFPAIDLRNGQCVRLLHGDPDQQTNYSDDPGWVAEQFAEAGAEWLHVVNLDGAFGDTSGSATNLEAIQAILDQVSIPIQLGGGIRTIEDIERLLNLGITRVILGTMAVERPRQILDIIARFGAEQIVIGIDARYGKVASHGWRKTSNLTATALGQQMQSLGVTRIVYTDISRDGALTGINVKGSKELAQETGLKVIISGGAATMDDVHQAHANAGTDIEGLIIGRALYTKAIDLTEAIEAAGWNPQCKGAGEQKSRRAEGQGGKGEEAKKQREKRTRRQRDNEAKDRET